MDLNGIKQWNVVGLGLLGMFFGACADAGASGPSSSGDAGAVPSRLRPLFPSQKAAAGAPVLGRGKVEALDSEDAAPDTHTPGGSQQSLLREVQSETT